MSTPQKVSGLLVPFNRWQEINSPAEGGRIVEMFAAGCLRETFAQRAKGFVAGLWEHGKSRLLGRKEVMRVARLWEETGGAYYEGTLTDHLPRDFLDRLRRGELGVSIGAKVLDADVDPRPGRTSWNPLGLETRVYRRLECIDVSLTARPAYREATAVLRSTPEHTPGMIWRAAPEPLVVTPEWWLPAQPPRPVPDYVGGEEHIDYLADPDSDRLIEYLQGLTDTPPHPKRA